MIEGDLNEKQNEALAKLREGISDVLSPKLDSDDFLLRWLRAQNYDVAKAEEMLRKSLVWRKQIGADDLVESVEVPEVLKKYYPVGLVGHDKTGCPVWVIPFGQSDIRGLMQAAKKSDYIRYTVHLMERSLRDMELQAERLEMKIGLHVIIFDLENFGMKHISWKPGIDLMIYIAKLLSENYPEVLKKIFVINTPKVFEMAYSIMKPFINEVTIHKIHMFGKDNWQEAILVDIDASELPVQWGGTKIDGTGDPRCPNLVCLGGNVPQSYYIAPANHMAEASNLQSVVVNKGTKMWLEKEVLNPGATLKWEFKTEDNDIGFGVYRQGEGQLEEVLTVQRVNCHLVPEDGQLLCTEPGKYMICFDNSFSRLRSKKLSYVIEVI